MNSLHNITAILVAIISMLLKFLGMQYVYMPATPIYTIYIRVLKHVLKLLLTNQRRTADTKYFNPKYCATFQTVQWRLSRFKTFLSSLSNSQIFKIMI